MKNPKECLMVLRAIKRHADEWQVYTWSAEVLGAWLRRELPGTVHGATINGMMSKAHQLKIVNVLDR